MLFIKKAASLIFALLLILTMLTSCELFGDNESKPQEDPDINCGLIINEICSSNETLLADSYGAYSDWIELYNSSSSDINLLGFSLTDDLSDKTKYSFGDATIKKGEYMIVFASGMDIHSGPELHTSFKISASGENVALYTPAGNRISLMEVPAMKADKTCGLASDGSVIVYKNATPGAKNDTAVYVPETPEDPVNTDTKDKITVRINEYSTKNCKTYTDTEGDFSAWAELYNYGTAAVSLSGLYLSDNDSNKKKWAFPNVTVEPGAYVIVFLGGKEIDYDGGSEFHADFILSGKEDTLGIYNGVGTAIDEIAVYDLFSNLSYGCGAVEGELAFFALATPGSVNSSTGFASIESARKLENKQIIINEVVAVCVDDADYDCDFIELYNPTDSAVDLSSFFIGKKESFEKAVNIPSIKLGAGEYRLVLFGDETAYYKKSDKLYVKLGLNRYSNNVYIFNANGVCIESISTGRLFDGVSCGYASLDSLSVSYFTDVTPCSANSSVTYSGAIRSPSFSLAGGYADAGTQVTLSPAQAGDVIYYTTDGSQPTINSTKYTGAITITKTVTIRAISYRSGSLPSDGVSASYIVGRVHDMAVVCLTADPDDLFSDDHGIYAEGYNYSYDNYKSSDYKTTNDAFTALIADAVDDANFFRDWEAKVRFDYIDAKGNQVLSFDAGAKTFGQYSRVRDQKSLTINLRDKYGMKEICYPFFGDDYVNVFSSLVLRNSGQDCYRSHIRDAFIAEAVRGEMDVEVMAYKPVAVYINGEYWGIYDLRERINEDFVANHTGADPDNLDLMKGTSIVLEGTSKAYKELYNFVKNNDMTVAANYKKVCSMMDIDNYIDYWITEIYFGNTDTGNIKFYREKTDDALWRWIPYDFDWSLQSTGNFFSRTFEGSSQVFTIAKQLIKNKTFKQKFIERFCYCLKTMFDTDRLLAIYDSLTNEIASEMPYHIERWSYRWSDTNIVLRNLASSPKSPAAWKNHVATVREYLVTRTEYVTKQLKSYFRLTDAQIEQYMS